MKNFFIAIFLLISIASFAQQPWTQNKGEGYFQAGASFFSYTAKFDESGDVVDINQPVSQFIFGAYGEYGLFEDFTVHANLPFQVVSIGEAEEDTAGVLPEASLFGPERLMAGFTWKILEKWGLIASLRGEVYFPTATFDNPSGLATGFDSWGIQPTLAIGTGVNKFFVAVETGVQLMSNDYSDRFVFKSQFGTSVGENDKWYIIGMFSTSSPFNELEGTELAAIDGNRSITALYQHNQAYVSPGIKIGYKFNELWSTWWSAGGGLGQDLGAAPVINASLGWNLKIVP